SGSPPGRRRGCAGSTCANFTEAPHAEGRLAPASRSLHAQASVEGPAEFLDFLLGALALPAVALLQLAGEVVAVALGDIENVVGELAPLRLGLALQLLPVAGDDVLVHAGLLELVGWRLAVDRIGESACAPRGGFVSRR